MLGSAFALLALASAGQANAAMPTSAAPQAATVLKQSRQALRSSRSLRATIVQHSELGGRPFDTSGDYYAGTFPQMRLRLKTSAEGQSLQFMCICDGQVLWSIRELRTVPLGAPASEDQVQQSVTRYDVGRLRTRLEEPSTPEQLLGGAIAFGGLPGLLAGLETSFDLRITGRDPNTIVLSGPWKPDALAKIRSHATLATLRVPTSAELTLDRSTLLPLRVRYLDGEGETASTVLKLELHDITTGEQIESSIFEYSPPEGVNIVDRTRSTIDALDALSPTDQASSAADQASESR